MSTCTRVFCAGSTGEGSSVRSRNNIDTRLIRFPPRTKFTPHRDAGMRGGNDIAILHQFGASFCSLRTGMGVADKAIRYTKLEIVIEVFRPAVVTIVACQFFGLGVK